jgi:hypothetical protein
MRKACERTWEQLRLGRRWPWTSRVLSGSAVAVRHAGRRVLAAARAGRADRPDGRAAGHRLRRARAGPDRIREPSACPGQRPDAVLGTTALPSLGPLARPPRDPPSTPHRARPCRPSRLWPARRAVPPRQDNAAGEAHGQPSGSVWRSACRSTSSRRHRRPSDSSPSSAWSPTSWAMRCRPTSRPTCCSPSPCRPAGSIPSRTSGTSTRPGHARPPAHPHRAVRARDRGRGGPGRVHR